MSYENDLMVKIAKLYYRENLKQESVARRLKISKYKVSRLLRKATDSGIVKILIIDPEEDGKLIS